MGVTVRDRKTGQIIGKYKNSEDAEKAHGKLIDVTDEIQAEWDLYNQKQIEQNYPNLGETIYIVGKKSDPDYTWVSRVNTVPTGNYASREFNDDYFDNIFKNSTRNQNPDGTSKSEFAKAVNGHDGYFGNPDLYHGDSTKDFLKFLGYMGLTGATIAAMGPEAALGAANLIYASDGVKNLSEDLHPLQTWDKIVNGDYKGAIRDSFAVGGDLLEIAPAVVGPTLYFAPELKFAANRSAGLVTNDLINEFSPKYTSTYNWRTGKFNLTPRTTENVAATEGVTNIPTTKVSGTQVKPKLIPRTQKVLPYEPVAESQGMFNKPWRSNPSKSNLAERFGIRGASDKGSFTLVRDNEPNYFSVHFNPTDANNPNAFSSAEKTALFQAIAEAIPEGGYLSTWAPEGSTGISRGGVAGLNRFGNLGFTQVGTRPALMRETGEMGEIPIWQKPFTPKLPYEPTSHVQGDVAVQMFKDYGGVPIPEGSINGEQLMKYVPEARERYGLVGNTNITDQEIAEALYKQALELGEGTAAVNVQGEPQLLFRGDTKRYTELKPRLNPDEVAIRSGTMDNSLGTLFLGEFPYMYQGADRYLGTYLNFNGKNTIKGSGTGSKALFDNKAVSESGIEGIGPTNYPLYSGLFGKHQKPISVYKLPGNMMETGVNDLNAFIVQTPAVRDASREISVLNDEWLIQGNNFSDYYGPQVEIVLDKDGFPLLVDKQTGEVVGDGLAGGNQRKQMAAHYNEVLKRAQENNEGLLKSNAGSKLRDEHTNYTYFALPNFNIRGAKHLLPYDLRIPRDWNNPNIYGNVSNNKINPNSGDSKLVMALKESKINDISQSYFNDVVSKLLPKERPLFRSELQGLDPNYPVEVVTKIPYNENWAGSHDYNTGENLILNMNNVDDMIKAGIHEGVSHGTDHSLSLAQNYQYNSILNKLISWSGARKNSLFNIMDSYNWEEFRATMNEARYGLNQYWKTADGHVNLKNIDKVSDEEILNAIENTNGYGKDYVRAYNQLNDQQKQAMMSYFRFILKYLPIVGGVVGTGIYLND